MCRKLSALSGIQASASETLMERSYDPKRARASIFVHRTLSAQRLARSQQTVSARAHSLCTHGSPLFISIVDVYHQSLFPLERSRAGAETSSPLAAALRRRPVSRTQHLQTANATFITVTHVIPWHKGVGGHIYYNEPKAWLLKRKWSEVMT